MKKMMMLLVAGFLGFAGSASASTFDLGTISPGTTSKVVANLGEPAPVAFDDTINFSLASIKSSLIGTLTDLSDFHGLPTDSLNFSLDLFNTSDPLTSLGHFADATGTVLAFSYLNLAAGDYFFKISGQADGAFGNSYRYKFEVSEVPLPPALLLFATALGGMAAFGYRRRNQQA